MVLLIRYCSQLAPYTAPPILISAFHPTIKWHICIFPTGTLPSNYIKIHIQPIRVTVFIGYRCELHFGWILNLKNAQRILH